MLRRSLARRSAAPLLAQRCCAPALFNATRLVHTEKRLAELGIELPAMTVPLANYTSCVQTGNLVFLSGHIPFKDLETKSLHVGKVGTDYTTAEGQAFARLIGLELVGTLKEFLGDLDRVTRIVKVVGFVNCPDDYGEQPEVLNGCSDVLGEIFQERGVHARSAVGTSILPRNVPVEIELIAEIKD